MVSVVRVFVLQPLFACSDGGLSFADGRRQFGKHDVIHYMILFVWVSDLMHRICPARGGSVVCMVTHRQDSGFFFFNYKSCGGKDILHLFTH